MSYHTFIILDSNLVQTGLAPSRSKSHRPQVLKAPNPRPQDSGGLNLHSRTKLVIALGAKLVLESWSCHHDSSLDLSRLKSATFVPIMPSHSRPRCSLKACIGLHGRRPVHGHTRPRHAPRHVRVCSPGVARRMQVDHRAVH